MLGILIVKGGLLLSVILLSIFITLAIGVKSPKLNVKGVILLTLIPLDINVLLLLLFEVYKSVEKPVFPKLNVMMLSCEK
jgi:hypothetical protein